MSDKLAKHKVRPDLRDYLGVVLRRRGFFVFEEKGDMITTDASEKQFEKAVVRAECEKRADRDGMPRHMTYIDKSEDKAKIIQETGINSFCEGVYNSSRVITIEVN